MGTYLMDIKQWDSIISTETFNSLHHDSITASGKEHNMLHQIVNQDLSIKPIGINSYYMVKPKQELIYFLSKQYLWLDKLQ